MKKEELKENVDFFLTDMANSYEKDYVIDIKKDVHEFMVKREFRRQDQLEVDVFVRYMIEKEIITPVVSEYRKKRYSFTDKGWNMIDEKRKLLSKRFRY